MSRTRQRTGTEPEPQSTGRTDSGLVIVRPGILSTVQDLGRPGYAALGVPESGAADRSAHRLANALVGNPAPDATIETVLGGLTVRAVGSQRVAVAGAPVTLELRRASGAVETAYSATVVDLNDGDVLRLGPPPWGLRSYLAVCGGVDVDPVLGSRSTDTLSGLGPPPLSRNQFLPVGGASGEPAPATAAPGIRAQRLEVTPGPHLEFLDPGALTAFCAQVWRVTPSSNRVGLRLDGDPLRRIGAAELPSAPMVAGAVQVPPSGLPVVFLRDHPATGGYPVVAVLTQDAIDRAAQLRPGAEVRFTVVDRDGPERAGSAE